MRGRSPTGSQPGNVAKRPEATLYERQRERDAANLTIEARQRTLDAAIEERFHYIERHREKTLADARNDVEAKVEQTLAHVRAIPALRQELVEARETLLWVAAYPEQVETFGFPHALALGLQKPIKDTLGTTARLDYTQIMQALEADADALAHAFSREQNEKLGQPIERTPETDAMWDSEIPDAWKRKQLEEAQQIAAYSLDPSKVAAEAKEFRPSP